MIASFVALMFAVGGPTAVDADLPPSLIVGGEAAATCQWPSAVAMLEADATPSMCTGSLIHTNVVMTAAHCIMPDRPIVTVGFGEFSEQAGTPEREVPILQCAQHPDFLDFGWPDIGFCTLQTPVLDVPIVPVMAGCETAALQLGTHAEIVGFGATFAELNPSGDPVGSGVGTKRHTTQFIDEISFDEGYTALTWNTGSHAACFGDSGGPSYAVLADGTWRVFGIAAHLYDPGDLPEPVLPGNVCGPGAIYTYATPYLPWLENSTGYDVTPCWSGDLWVGGSGCGELPAAPDVGGGAWASGCSGAVVMNGGPSCDAVEPPPLPPPPDPPDPPPPSDTGDDFGESGDDFGETGLDDAGPASDDGPPPPNDTGTPPPAPPNADDESESSGTDDGVSQADTELANRGCACRSTPKTSPVWWLWVVALGLRRRRSHPL